MQIDALIGDPLLKWWSNLGSTWWWTVFLWFLGSRSLFMGPNTMQRCTCERWWRVWRPSSQSHRYNFGGGNSVLVTQPWRCNHGNLTLGHQAPSSCQSVLMEQVCVYEPRLLYNWLLGFWKTATASCTHLYFPPAVCGVVWNKATYLYMQLPPVLCTLSQFSIGPTLAPLVKVVGLTRR
jgi:hypothetical protein